jgi:hypothetical protein
MISSAGGLTYAGLLLSGSGVLMLAAVILSRPAVQPIVASAEPATAGAS